MPCAIHSDVLIFCECYHVTENERRCLWLYHYKHLTSTSLAECITAITYSFVVIHLSNTSQRLIYLSSVFPAYISSSAFLMFRFSSIIQTQVTFVFRKKCKLSQKIPCQLCLQFLSGIPKKKIKIKKKWLRFKEDMKCTHQLR